MSADEPIYTMAVAARLTGMHPQTLRKYERAGLITPARPSGFQRLYSASDVDRLRRIHHMVEQRGVNIAGLELALAMTDRLDAIEADASRAEMRAGIDEAREISGEGRRPATGIRVGDER